MKNIVFQLKLPTWKEEAPFDEAYETVKAYAKRVGADYFHMEEELVDVPMKGAGARVYFQKYYFLDLLNDYDKVLYVDADVVIRETCPNLFLKPPDRFYGVLEANRQGFHRLVEEFLETSDWHCDWHMTDGLYEYFNAGLFLVSRELRDRYFADFTLPEKPMKFYDQTWLNYWLQRARVPWEDLGTKFNFLLNYYARKSAEDGRFDAHIIHYTGPTKSLILPDIRSGICQQSD